MRNIENFYFFCMREFNVTGRCLPDEHYMVDISEKVRLIAAMVERGDYFTINRARQYGKTTTLWTLEEELVKKGYTVTRISFEGIGDEPFESEKEFCQSLLRQIYEELKWYKAKGSSLWKNKSITTFKKLDAFLNTACKNKKFVLMIDETDKTSNNLVFLRFIGMLRDKYLKRGRDAGATFQSVILCGVYDIKNLKVKLVKSGLYQLKDGEKRINSPWNIAANFEVDMSFSASEIATMLNEYEKDHKTGMNIEEVSKEIRVYTSGYPYLVSRICQKIDRDLEKDWTKGGVQRAVQAMLFEKNFLFDDLGKNLESDENFCNLLYDIAVNGKSYEYTIINPSIDWGVMFGILRNQNGKVVIDNRIFEILIYNYFVTKRRIEGIDITGVLPSEVINNGKFDMALAVKKFAQHYHELYSDRDNKFLERECRLLFLTYIKPLINGNGFYHVESETRDSKRMDVLIDFGSEQFIIELKIWKGEQKHEKAHEQLISYLNSKNKTEGYLVTFDFRKRRLEKPSVKWVRKGKKRFLDCLAV